MNKLRTPTLLLLLISTILTLSAEELTLNLKIQNVNPGKGNIVVRIYRSKASFDKRTPEATIKRPASASEIVVPIKGEAGEYVFSIYQDENSNGELDKYFFGMPKEPVGMSSRDGKSASREFEKAKLRIDRSQTITIGLRSL